MLTRAANAVPVAPLAAAEVLSFLKETRGMLTWTEADLANSLKISKKDEKQALTLLELQGYIKAAAAEPGAWLTTEDGNIVSGSAAPRFARQRVLAALTSLGKQLKAVNRQSDERYRVRDAVAFGDFLNGQARVQAADVGIRLERKKSGNTDNTTIVSGSEHRARRAFLKKLRNKNPMFQLHAYEAV